ncbi:MAG: hypothetical protein A2445_02735 [Candidatus Jacksonbacteria bacterium RIFOXYC2_FULL_44_29]|nr:MAG: Transcriptional regulator, TrmB [Parcubacteria group bacterium GW2011_GWA2_42_28]KKT55917.1 MAG: Transcriptional regulator, TrmB [Parcubacteria group bacterium GW2011_GWC2_44_22]OGY74529.1 MAG: hypothetical protein A2240_02990 [Candidatus Jacksonbacteria bacterium RIFOXYA2_FULL_43_12]OGY77439.1 MAG: hypothetical protein A2295_01940 [Candidatus Jacksonbacteria bacterium RIFOXYB2_FULL_44_15]OGY78211.1 MAG: hypothetical protein A2550_06285 [Candidatus Jacksonbacteria bacterium RIFOXYD2_FUL
MESQKEVKNIVYDSLKELGLTRHEINLYTLSLAIGPASVSKIAQHLNVSRPNVYKVITGLESRGLAHFSKRRRFSRSFMVESPCKMLELLRKKRELLERLDQGVTQNMPQLLGLFKQGSLPTSIKVIEGRDQFLKLFYQIIDEVKDVSEFFGSVKDFIGFISWAEERRWIKQRIRKGVTIKALLLPSKDSNELKSTDSQEMRETRILHVKTPFLTSFQLFSNKVIIWQPKAALAILIEDQYIVAMLKSIFYTFWQTGEV